jgi:hypothetical protein
MLARTQRLGASRLAASALMLLLSASSYGCGAAETTNTIPLLSAAGIPITMTPPGDVSLEVVTRSTAVRDPLPVTGSSYAYADLEGALGHAISTATIPWADAHKTARPGGLQLVVDIVEAKVEFDAGRLKVTLTTRATLRTRRDHEYIAQTQASCRDAGLTDPGHGALVIYGCMTRLGRDLAGWLGSAPL